MVVIADHARHLPGAVFQQPDMKEIGLAVAEFRFAVVVDVEVMLAGEHRTVSDAIVLQWEDLDGRGDGFAAEAEIRVAAQVLL